MKGEINIETYTTAAFRAIRPAIVEADLCNIGVNTFTIFAIIRYEDYPYLVDLVAHAAAKAEVHRSEYSIVTIKNIPEDDNQ